MDCCVFPLVMGNKLLSIRILGFPTPKGEEGKEKAKGKELSDILIIENEITSF